MRLGIGVWVSRRIRTEDDYLVAGRRLGYPLAIFSIFATWFGAETIVGSAGRTLRDGVSLSSAIVTYFGGLVTGFPYPFVTSLVVSVAAYGAGAALEATRLTAARPGNRFSATPGGAS